MAVAAVILRIAAGIQDQVGIRVVVGILAVAGIRVQALIQAVDLIIVMIIRKERQDGNR